MKQLLTKISHAIQHQSSYSKDKSNKLGEVFTPVELINEMLAKLPRDTWEDKDKTWFDPAAGKGNFPIQILKKLFVHLQEHIPDEAERLQHIIENQLYMAEYQRESAEFINKMFSFGDRFKVNLYIGDTLTMPEDFFDLSWEDRRVKYKDNCI